MNNQLIKVSKDLSNQSQSQLIELSNKLQPYLKQYIESKGAISHIYLEWLKREATTNEAKKYVQPFMEELGISKGYLSKLRTVNTYRQETLEGEPDSFLKWFDSHGIDKQYQLAKANFNDVVVLWQEGEKVSYETLQTLKDNTYKPTAPTPQLTEEDKECIRLGIGKERRDFLDLIINNETLNFINDYRLANYWSGLTKDELLIMIEQMLAVNRGNEPCPFELRLRDLIGHEIRIRDQKKQENIERDKDKRNYVGL